MPEIKINFTFILGWDSIVIIIIFKIFFIKILFYILKFILEISILKQFKNTEK
jgi:hypothetical protein